jgi:hypothetical protein
MVVLSFSAKRLCYTRYPPSKALHARLLWNTSPSARLTLLFLIMLTLTRTSLLLHRILSKSPNIRLLSIL